MFDLSRKIGCDCNSDRIICIYIYIYVFIYIYIYILIQYTKNFVQHVQISPETCNNGPPGGKPWHCRCEKGTFLPDPNDQYALVLVPANQGTLVRSLVVDVNV